MPSLQMVNPKDARHGDGQYLSDILPGSHTPGRLARVFLNDPRGWRRFTNYVAVDVTGLAVVQCRPNVYLVAGNDELDLNGRIVGHGIA